MPVRVLDSAIYLHNLHARLPFQYGIAEMRALPQLFLQVTCEVDGRVSTGVAADGLAPKWFTKYPDTTYEQDVAEMLEVISRAARFAGETGAAGTVFELWRAVYAAQQAWSARASFPPLLWNFGVSLVERAVIDAFCRAKQVPFIEAVHGNLLGIDLAAIHPELYRRTPADLLPAVPPRAMYVRHTIGMADPLEAGEQSSANGKGCAADGLPCTLAENIRTYGLQYFKIKVRGDQSEDLPRLRRIARVIQEQAGGRFAFTLDGNEQFSSVEAFQEFWNTVRAQADLKAFLRHLLFVEQPLKRNVALSDGTRTALQRWRSRPPMIVDESDADLDSLPRALACGYAGTSHKNCKGVFKGLANAGLLAFMNERNPEKKYLMSGEDLINIGPVALLQDLAVMAVLGLEHVERNGHQYFSGLSVFPMAVQEQVMKAHPDLYIRHPAGFATLNISHGQVSLESVLDAPFGVGMELDLENQFTALKNWRFESLEKTTPER